MHKDTHNDWNKIVEYPIRLNSHGRNVLHPQRIPLIVHIASGVHLNFSYSTASSATDAVHRKKGQMKREFPEETEEMYVG
jgi:hypothetical protein